MQSMTARYPSKNVTRRYGIAHDQELDHRAPIQDDDQEARDRLVRANLGLVVTIARAYRGRGLALEDLVGEGNLGLIRAAERFDPNIGVWFATYAGYVIRQVIRDALRSKAGTIRVPTHMRRLLSKWRSTERTLCSDWGRVPCFEEIASHLRLSERQKSLVRHAHRALRLTTAGSYSGEASNPLLDGATDRNEPVGSGLQVAEDRHRVLRWLEDLDDRARTVLAFRFGFNGEPESLQQVGSRLGLSGELVRKIEARAIGKLARDHHQEAFE